MSLYWSALFVLLWVLFVIQVGILVADAKKRRSYNDAVRAYRTRKGVTNYSSDLFGPPVYLFPLDGRDVLERREGSPNIQLIPGGAVPDPDRAYIDGDVPGGGDGRP